MLRIPARSLCLLLLLGVVTVGCSSVPEFTGDVDANGDTSTDGSLYRDCIFTEENKAKNILDIVPPTSPEEGATTIQREAPDGSVVCDLDPAVVVLDRLSQGSTLRFTSAQEFSYELKTCPTPGHPSELVSADSWLSLSPLPDVPTFEVILTLDRGPQLSPNPMQCFDLDFYICEDLCEDAATRMDIDDPVIIDKPPTQPS